MSWSWGDKHGPYSRKSTHARSPSEPRADGGSEPDARARGRRAAGGGADRPTERTKRPTGPRDGDRPAEGRKQARPKTAPDSSLARGPAGRPAGPTQPSLARRKPKQKAEAKQAQCRRFIYMHVHSWRRDTTFCDVKVRPPACRVFLDHLITCVSGRGRPITLHGLQGRGMKCIKSMHLLMSSASFFRLLSLLL